MTLSSSHDLTVNVPYVHFLPEYRPQLDVSLSPEDDSEIPCIFRIAPNPVTKNFGEFPYHPLVDEYANDIKWPRK
jgi:hypothetical protein